MGFDEICFLNLKDKQGGPIYYTLICSGESRCTHVYNFTLHTLFSETERCPYTIEKRNSTEKKKSNENANIEIFLLKK